VKLPWHRLLRISRRPAAATTGENKASLMVFQTNEKVPIPQGNAPWHHQCNARYVLWQEEEFLVSAGWLFFRAVFRARVYAFK